MSTKVFVDGQEGTTGLQINERLAKRADIETLVIAPEKRKDVEERRKLLNAADIVFLCLPDTAAKEAVALVDKPSVRVIDASTAHRTDPVWAYGLPELDKNRREWIRRSSRVNVPGCYATGFNLILYPLVKLGIVPANYPVSVHAVSGYSGGGKKLIAAYEGPDADLKKLAPSRHYALGLAHKHIPEMHAVSGLDHPPLFTPLVGPFYKGMSVAVPLHARVLNDAPSAGALHEALAKWYEGERFVRVMPFASEDKLDSGFLDPQACNDTNFCDLFVFGHVDQAVVIARLDNLGKGSSGAAVQCMNLLMGIDEGTGLG